MAQLLTLALVLLVCLPIQGQNSGYIQGGSTTDGQVIGNVSDSLKVHCTNCAGASSTYAILPANNSIPMTMHLKRASDSRENQNVNGSSTQQEFLEGPSGTDVWYVTQISLLMIDPGGFNADNFGSIGALSNGFEFDLRIGGTDYRIGEVFSNKEIVNEFTDERFTSQSDQDDALFSEDDWFAGVIKFPHPVKLQGPNDKILTTVRDNLTSIDHIRVTIKAFKVLP